jgi:hypothetical protein
MMAKKVQMSTVEMVAKALTDKGYVVDDVELDKGTITVAALAPHGSTLLDSFKQTEARKWLDSVPDMSIVDVEPELTIEEWEAQYGHVTDDDVAQALAPMIEPEQVRDDLNREIAADNLEDYHNQPIVVEEVEPVAVEAAPETHEEEMKMDARLDQDLEAEEAIIKGELDKARILFEQGLIDEPLAILRAAQSSKGGIITKEHPLWDAYEELGSAICKARRAANRAAKKAAPETPEGETNMETKVEEAGCKLCGELYPVGDLTDGVCPPCIIEAHRENAEPEDVSEALAHEDNLYSQYLSVRTEYFDENPDLAMVFEAMTFRRFLVVRYQTDYPNGTSITRERKLLPSHVYQAASTEGICVVAYDTYRKEVRTFRVDKFRACRLGECAPEATGDAVTIYPAAYEVRRAVPQRVKNPANYIASGKWSSKPLPQVLVQ